MSLKESFIEHGANIYEYFTLPNAHIQVNINNILEHAENNETYLIKGRSVYMICYTPLRGFYAHKMATKPAGGVPLTNRGYYHWADKELAHKMIEACHE